MLIRSLRRYLAVALPLVGSAILLYSCESSPQPVQVATTEVVMTEYSENLSITMSENGRKSYHFETPLMEGYAVARDPYREFRKGIKITIFDDNTGEESASLVANYAIFYEDRKLWEVKGDVVAINSDGRQLFTSQLFWNQATHKVYSNVDSKLVDGDEVHHCEGFESDEQMKDWTYRKLKGVTYVDDEQLERRSQPTEEKSSESEAEQSVRSARPRVDNPRSKNMEPRIDRRRERPALELPARRIRKENQ